MKTKMQKNVILVYGIFVVNMVSGIIECSSIDVLMNQYAKWKQRWKKKKNSIELSWKNKNWRSKQKRNKQTKKHTHTHTQNVFITWRRALLYRPSPRILWGRWPPRASPWKHLQRSQTPAKNQGGQKVAKNNKQCGGQKQYRRICIEVRVSKRNANVPDTRHERAQQQTKRNHKPEMGGPSSPPYWHRKVPCI